MLQPRTKSAPESTWPAAAKAGGEKLKGGSPLGDRVRSLSLANLPERRISASSALGWILVIGMIGGTGWYWWSLRSAAAKILATKAASDQKSPRPSSSAVESPTKPMELTPATGAPEKPSVRP